LSLVTNSVTNVTLLESVWSADVVPFLLDPRVNTEICYEGEREIEGGGERDNTRQRDRDNLLQAL
jgi:hypothetical protein